MGYSGGEAVSGRPLILSIFPGIDLLGRAFEAVWPAACVVPDLLWGGDITTFHPPAGVFDGVIGGPPCQQFSSLVHLLRAQGREPKHPNEIPAFERVVTEAQSAWRRGMARERDASSRRGSHRPRSLAADAKMDHLTQQLHAAESDRDCYEQDYHRVHEALVAAEAARAAALERAYAAEAQRDALMEQGEAIARENETLRGAMSSGVAEMLAALRADLAAVEAMRDVVKAERDDQWTRRMIAEKARDAAVREREEHKAKYHAAQRLLAETLLLDDVDIVSHGQAIERMHAAERRAEGLANQLQWLSVCYCDSCGAKRLPDVLTMIDAALGREEG